MSKLVVTSALTVLASCSEPVQRSIYEPPVAIGVDDASWKAEGATLAAYDRVGERVMLPLFSLRCEPWQTGEVEVIGLLPAQAFPQPPVELRIGRMKVAERHPTAVYRAGLGPDPRNYSPEHPPFAILQFFVRITPAMLASLQTGAPLSIRFHEQEVVYPKIPSQVINSFVEACEAAQLPRTGPAAPPR